MCYYTGSPKSGIFICIYSIYNIAERQTLCVCHTVNNCVDPENSTCKYEPSGLTDLVIDMCLIVTVMNHKLYIYEESWLSVIERYIYISNRNCPSKYTGGKLVLGIGRLSVVHLQYIIWLSAIICLNTLSTIQNYTNFSPLLVYM